MKSRDKLILLADSLDRKGFAAEASIVDEIITKRSFDEETRKDTDSVFEMVFQLLDELDSAIEFGVKGLESPPDSGQFIKGWSGAIEDESLKNYYKDKISKLKETAQHAKEFVALTSEDGSFEEDAAMPNPGPPTDEDEAEESPQKKKHWWKFWGKPEDATSEEGEEEGDSGGEGFIIGPDGKKHYTGAIPPQEVSHQEEAILEEPEDEGGEATEELPAGTGVRDRGDPTDWWNKPENRDWTSRMYGGENNPDLRGKV